MSPLSRRPGLAGKNSDRKKNAKKRVFKLEPGFPVGRDPGRKKGPKNCPYVLNQHLFWDFFFALLESLERPLWGAFFYLSSGRKWVFKNIWCGNSLIKFFRARSRKWPKMAKNGQKWHFLGQKSTFLGQNGTFWGFLGTLATFSPCGAHKKLEIKVASWRAIWKVMRLLERWKNA